MGVVSELVGPVEGQAASQQEVARVGETVQTTTVLTFVWGQDDIEGVYSNNGGQIWQLREFALVRQIAKSMAKV